jgi:tRNA A-37 threonylcarbamoyl transferase component Bud32
MSDLTGQRLGQYQILARISKGPVSTIYKAYQPKLDRFVAIKVLSPHVVDEEGFLERFSQEARAVAQLDHPNIVPVYDFDQVGDIAYIVLKYVESGTLRSMMTGQPMDLGLTVDLITQVGLALGYAHKHGVIHRDVKPSNILIGEGRWALLTDFGLAKILGGGQQLTRSGIGMGTPDYLAPEQAQGMSGDGRADLYSLGATLYEMVTGHVPFEADSSMAVVVKHITEPPPPPSQINPGLPAEVERVILTAMDKNPAARFQTAEEMVAALIRAATPSIAPSAAPSVQVAARSAARPLGAKLGLWPSLLAKARRFGANVRGATFRPSRRGWMALGGAVLMALVLLLVWGSQWAKSPVTQAGLLPTGMPTPLPATATKLPAVATAASILTATSTSEPASALAVTPTPAVTPVLTMLSSSTPIRLGIYVKAIKPDGVILRKGAGFDADYITTLPMGTILYVQQGPADADSLRWFWLSDGVRSGWARQDEVVAYAVKKVP